MSVFLDPSSCVLSSRPLAVSVLPVPFSYIDILSSYWQVAILFPFLIHNSEWAVCDNVLSVLLFSLLAGQRL